MGFYAFLVFEASEAQLRKRRKLSRFRASEQSKPRKIRRSYENIVKYVVFALSDDSNHVTYDVLTFLNAQNHVKFEVLEARDARNYVTYVVFL